MFSSMFRFFGCYPVADNHKKAFEQAPEHRRCTNIVWLFLFVIFLTGLVFIGFFSTQMGDHMRFFYATDSFGNRCGMKNVLLNINVQEQILPFPSSGMDFRNRSFLFPMDVNRANESAWICVEKCPQSTFSKANELADHIARTGDFSLCSVEFFLNKAQNPRHSLLPNVSDIDFANIGPCPRTPVYRSKSRINRCIPEEIRDLPSASIAKLQKIVGEEDFMRQLFSDLYAGRYVFLVVIFVSLATSLFITYSMIWNNTRIVYLFYVTTMPCGIVCSVILLCTSIFNFVGSFFLETKYLALETNCERFVNRYRVEYGTLFALCALYSLFTLISWVIMWTIFKPRRNLVSELFFQARKPLKCMLWLVPETLFNCIFSLALFVLWLFVLLNLLSIEEPEWYIINTSRRSSHLQESAVSAIRMRSPWWINFALAYHVFAFFWIKSFLSDAQKIFVAQATSTWYFGENRKSVWKMVFLRSLYFLFCYHLGTVAFGSLLLLFVRIPSHIYLFIYYRIAKSERPTLVAFYNRNFIWLSETERVLRYIHSNAYAVVGANGEDFVAACKTATNLWLDNSWNLMTTNTVAALLFTMTKFTFSLTVGFICGVYFRMFLDVEYWLWPAFLCSALAFYIMNRFLALHQMIIETMFLCYASEIDGFESQRQISASGLPKKTDYGFNYYMARRIYEERYLNSSSLGFSLSAISVPSPIAQNANAPPQTRPSGGLGDGHAAATAFIAAATSHGAQNSIANNANDSEHENFNLTAHAYQHDYHYNSGGYAGYHMTSTPQVRFQTRFS